ncbi:MAG: hypothetical protein EP329_28425, partial [Deltaproteobacteria bacterium]
MFISDEVAKEDVSVSGGPARSRPRTRSIFEGVERGDDAPNDLGVHEHTFGALVIPRRTSQVRRRLAIGAVVVGGAVAVFLLTRSPAEEPHLATPTAATAP